jgi:DNA topoisomerase-1
VARKTQTSGKALVIVESPSKARTINKYLGRDYTVMASMGHVRDLPPSNFGIDIERGFEPEYQVLQDKRKVVGELKKAAAKAGRVYLATDLDREGEAIAWHLVHALGLDEADTKRVVFNEITQSAIRQAFSHPQELDMEKVNAQQARRILDRIVGYQLSPLLQRKIARGLSAGRVQSVAVRLIVEREREIRAFLPEESWRIFGVFATEKEKADKLAAAWETFQADAQENGNGRSVKQRNTWLSKHGCLYTELIKLGGQECKLANLEEARAVAEALGFVVQEVKESDFEEYAKHGLRKKRLIGAIDRGASGACSIKAIQKRRTTTRPSAPFTTAALQQAASSTLGFGPARTMRIAQQLYEGVDLGDGEGPVGLITYMRTDSTNLSKESVGVARTYIQQQFGDAYVPTKPNVFGKVKRAQEAHEAIRPTEVNRTPESLKGHLSGPQLKLYELIWRRFISCQMSPAQWDSTTVLVARDTSRGEALFRTSGRRLVFDGYLRVMKSTQSDEVVLPELEEGQPVAPLAIEPKQQFSSPPPRYTEASLVKKLESEGIGRPSTYAAIIQTIQNRGYVELIDKTLQPTERGELVTDKLVAHFPRIMNVKFTSHMEDELDKIEEAHLDWVHVLGEFYEPFKESLERAQSEMPKERGEPSKYTCPECGQEMVYRLGRNGKFLSCSGYPDCRVTMNVDRDGKPIEEPAIEESCPDCGRSLALKRSRLGLFLGCTGYPECNYTTPCDEQGVPLRKVDPEEIEETCSECGSRMVVKFSRGKAFLGCSAYPKCKGTKPLPPGVYVEKPKPQEAGVHCDKCGRPMVIRTGRRGPFLSCSGFPRCRNAMPMDKIDHLKALAAEGKIPEAPREVMNGNGNGRRRNNVKPPKTKDGKVDMEALGPPPAGFAWTRTGRPVVETWPEEKLICPDCGGEMALKTGRFGPYWGCTDYPKCQFVANMRGEAKKRAEAEHPTPAKPKPIPTDIPCDECGSPMVIRNGRTGPFLGCSKYPKCKATKPMPAGETAETLAAGKA